MAHQRRVGSRVERNGRSPRWVKVRHAKEPPEGPGRVQGNPSLGQGMSRPVPNPRLSPGKRRTLLRLLASPDPVNTRGPALKPSSRHRGDDPKTGKTRRPGQGSRGEVQTATGGAGRQRWGRGDRLGQTQMTGTRTSAAPVPWSVQDRRDRARAGERVRSE